MLMKISRKINQILLTLVYIDKMQSNSKTARFIRIAVPLAIVTLALNTVAANDSGGTLLWKNISVDGAGLGKITVADKNPNHILALGIDYEFYYTADMGENWHGFSNPLPTMAPDCFAVSTDGTLLMLGGDLRTVISHDQGRSFQDISPPAALSDCTFDATQDQTVLAYASGMGPIKSENGGLSWRFTNTPIEITGNKGGIYQSVHDPADYFAWSSTQILLQSEDSGENWLPMPSTGLHRGLSERTTIRTHPRDGSIYGTTFSPPHVTFRYNYLHHYDPDSQSWSITDQDNSFGYSQVRDFIGSRAGNRILATLYDIQEPFVISRDHGRTWIQKPQPWPFQLGGFSLAQSHHHPNLVFLSGYGLRVSENYGRSWQTRLNGLHRPAVTWVTNFTSTSDGRYLAYARFRGFVVRNHDDSSWRQLDIPADYGYGRFMHKSNDDIAWVWAQNHGLLRIDDETETFITQFPAREIRETPYLEQGVIGVLNRSKSHYLLFGNRDVLKSTDRGTTWQKSGFEEIPYDDHGGLSGFFSDRNDRIWLTLANRLYRETRPGSESWHEIELPQAFPLRKLIRTPTGDIFAITSEEPFPVFRWGYGCRCWKRNIRGVDAEPLDIVFARNRLWIATTNGLYVSENNGHLFRRLHGKTLNSAIHKLFVGHDQNLVMFDRKWGLRELYDL